MCSRLKATVYYARSEFLFNQWCYLILWLIIIYFVSKYNRWIGMLNKIILCTLCTYIRATHFVTRRAHHHELDLPVIWLELLFSCKVTRNMFFYIIARKCLSEYLPPAIIDKNFNRNLSVLFFNALHRPLVF